LFGISHLKEIEELLVISDDVDKENQYPTGHQNFSFDKLVEFDDGIDIIGMTSSLSTSFVK
jgi:hypothetical protein